MLFNMQLQTRLERRVPSPESWELRVWRLKNDNGIAVSAWARVARRERRRNDEEEGCKSSWGYGFDRVPFSGQSIKTFKIKLYDDKRKEFSFALNSSASFASSSSTFFPFSVPWCLLVSGVQSFSVTLWGMFFPQINHCCHTKFSHCRRHTLALHPPFPLPLLLPSFSYCASHIIML